MAQRAAGAGGGLGGAGARRAPHDGVTDGLCGMLYVARTLCSKSLLLATGSADNSCYCFDVGGPEVCVATLSLSAALWPFADRWPILSSVWLARLSGAFSGVSYPSAPLAEPTCASGVSPQARLLVPD